MIRANRLILGALLSLGSPAFAQLMGASELKVGVPAKGIASAKPVADIYYLAGESGAKETYAFAGKGPASLTLFGPDGSEILSANGSGSVKLEVVLPFTDVFTIAVARKNPAQTYTLMRKTTVPTLAEALAARGVGYAAKDESESQCWILPGVKMRINYPAGRSEHTIAADRNTVAYVGISAKNTITADSWFKYDGETVHRTRRYPDGTVKEASYKATFPYSSEEDGRFVGYLCKG